MTQEALIIVDLQNDFVEGGALGVPGANVDFVTDIDYLIQEHTERGNMIIFTQDFHPDGHCSFAEGDPEYRDGSWPVHCVQGTFGAGWADGFFMPPDSEIVQKGIDVETEEYSGFANPVLDALLQSEKIKIITVVGLATDYCVKETAIAGAQFGYEVFVDLKYCRAVNAVTELHAVEEMLKNKVNVITVKCEYETEG